MLSKANQSEVLSKVYSTYRANVPKVHLDIDREKVEKLGISMDSLNNVLETYLGSVYVNQFNKFGQVYKVMLQIQSQFRDKITDIYNLYVLNKDKKRVQLKTFLKGNMILGPDVVSHYNMLTSAKISGSAAPGYSSGQAIAEIEKLSKENLSDE